MALTGIEKMRRYRNRKMAQGLCCQCSLPLEVGKTYCKDCLSKKKRVNVQLKKTVIRHYGGHCVWPDCDVTDLDILTLDHIANDGFKERFSGVALYQQLVSNGFPENKYQILCFNHQWKKRVMLLRNEEIPVDVRGEDVTVVAA